MKPTEEQALAVDMAVSGGSLKIEAKAGTGKTKVLRDISEALPGQGLFLSHGKKVAEEGKAKLSAKTECSTFNSLAFRMMGSDYHGKIGGRLTGAVVAQAGCIPSLKIRDNLMLPPSALGYEVLKGIQRFCETVDTEFSAAHFPDISLKGLSEDETNLMTDMLCKASARVYSKMADPTSTLPCLHGVYVKEFVVKEVDLGKDYLLVDEFQDSDPLMMHFLRAQKSTQMIFAGDRHQSINEWRGAKNIMKRAQTQNTAYLTQSFRFGQRIADRANEVLTRLGSEKLLVGNPKITSWIGHVDSPDAILCRTNAECAISYFNLSEAACKGVVASGLSDAEAFIMNMLNLSKGGKGTGEYALFKSDDELRNYVYSDQGRDLYLYLDLIDKHGFDFLVKKIEQSKRSEQQLGVRMTITTGHRAKGLEFDHVRVVGNFMDEENKGQEDYEQESNLTYVVLTRAKIAMEENIVGFKQGLQEYADTAVHHKG